MKDQSDAAAGRLVEWHFAEKPVADYFRVLSVKQPWATSEYSTRWQTHHEFKLWTFWATAEKTPSMRSPACPDVLGPCGVHRAFALWNRKAYSCAAADKLFCAMPPRIEELTDIFAKGRRYKDIPRKPWPERGLFDNRLERARRPMRSFG